MKTILPLLVFAMSVLPLRAVKTGDTYEQVITEKGTPETRLQAGDTLILNYADQRVKLKGNIVVNINSKLPEVTRAAPEVATSEGWTTNYAGALSQARQQKAKVFLFFTGSDWCGWCKRLDREILSTDAFRSYANGNLVLVKLDFPNAIPQSDALKAQNAQLASKYQIHGYPTVIVLDSQGRQVGQLGYQEGGPGPFIDALKSF